MNDKNTTSDVTPDELNQLDEWLIQMDGGMFDADQIDAFQALLRRSPTARQQYVQWQWLSAAMQLESAVARIDDSSWRDVHVDPNRIAENATVTPEVSKDRFRWQPLLSLAAGIALCMMLGRWAYLEWGDAAGKTTAMTAGPNGELIGNVNTIPGHTIPGQSRVTEATSSGIAMVTRLVDATWQDDTAAAEVGTALTPGPLRLKSGLAQIEFFCGATVVLEGPAEIELVSATEAKFHQGRLRAQVPPAARGFQIGVDDMKVVDLGTEFGLAVSASGADVQVFDGEVELHQPLSATQLIKAGEAFNKGDAKVRLAKSTPDQFVDLAKLDTQANDQTTQRYQRWLRYSKKLRSDPRLIAYYALDDTHRWNRKLLNKATAAESSDRNEANVQGDGVSHQSVASELDGAIVGAHRVAGRWPMKDALEFKQPGDRVRVNIPGEFRSLTFAAWVKIDSLDRWYNSLFLTDNYQSGEPHWQILDTGQLFFSVRPTDSDKGPEHKKVLSPPFWNPTLSGKWLHLATTYDVDAKQTTHYLNGKPIHQEQIPDLQLVPKTRIGMASIGNWSMPTKDDDHFAVRNLNGSLDELAIFNAALTPDQIATMYEMGKP